MTPLFSLKQRDYLRFRPQWGCFCPLNNPYPKAPNCPHCGQLCLPKDAHDTLAFSCFSSMQAPYPSPRRKRQVSSIPLHLLFRPNPLRWASVEFPVLPHVGATPGFWVFGGYAPGCARKIGHSRDTRLTRVDRRFSAAPVGTLPTAFGCVPAHIPRPILQVSARKTAGWSTEWAGVYTEGFRFACGRPV